MVRINTIHNSDCLEKLKRFPSDSIDCILTHLPIWNSDKQDDSRELGNETHPQAYVNSLLKVMAECKRVLKPRGTILIVICDRISDQELSQSSSSSAKSQKDSQSERLRRLLEGEHAQEINKWYSPGQKLLLPHRIAIRCQEDLGLIVIHDIQWPHSLHTRSAMNRMKKQTGSYELTDSCYRVSLLLSKEQDYYFNIDSVSNLNQRLKTTKASNLVAREETTLTPESRLPLKQPDSDSRYREEIPVALARSYISSACPTDGIVLDPFAGIGNTLVTAKELDRNFVGIENNSQLVEQAKERLKELKEKRCSSKSRKRIEGT